jgi:protein-S-isoprenylcysteine O-methyltransferase Ste14
MSRLPDLGPRGEGWVALQAVAIVVTVAATTVSPGPWPEPIGSVAVIAGWALFAGGGVLIVAGLASLRAGLALTAVPRPRDEARLVEEGPYALVRHPVYGGLILAAVGGSLTRASIAGLLASAALLVVLDLKRRREEAWLERRYPGYAAYRARTRRLIPWIW